MFAVKLILNFTIMLKNILKLDGAQALSKNEQNKINGGGQCGIDCWVCYNNRCMITHPF